MKIKNNFIYKNVRALVRYFRLLRTFHNDILRYYRYSMMIDNTESEKLKSLIMMDAHVIEKGITMPKSRLGFGIPRLTKLINNLIIYTKNYGLDDQINIGFDVVVEYFSIHEINGFEFNSLLIADYSNLKKIIGSTKNIATFQPSISKSEYFSYSQSNFKDFSNSRKSIRHFTGEKIALNLLVEAINNARNSPSACNRQGARVHIFEDDNQLEKILEVQGGNRGFGHLCSHVIAITFESRCYFEENERYLGYVDGGIFSMNLLYHLHSLEIGACILNASNTISKDLEMRKQTGISPSEFFVCYIGVGVVPETFKYAASHRFDLDKYLKVH